jgi:hypothetical protein
VLIVATAESPGIMYAAIKTVTRVAADPTITAILSGTVAAPAEGVRRAMLLNKFKARGALMLVVLGVFALGESLSPRRSVAQPRPRKPAAVEAVPKEVSGKLLTPIEFKAAARAKVAEAALALLASCHYAHQPNEGPSPDWDGLRLDALNRWCHLYIHLAKPQTVKTATGAKIVVTELLIVLNQPKGGLYVRVGDKAKRFGKYVITEANRLQECLKEAEPIPLPKDPQMSPKGTK